MLPRLIIRSSSIHAAGCYTTQPIRKGRRVVEYGGQRLSKDLADKRYANRDITYLFTIDGTTDVIDGFGTAMFLNHSCKPNCQTVGVGKGKKERIFIVALRNIAAGEELVYEYNLCDSDEDDLEDTAACYCGAPKCRGTMYSDEELKRRAKHARKKERSDAKKKAHR